MTRRREVDIAQPGSTRIIMRMEKLCWEERLQHLGGKCERDGMIEVHKRKQTVDRETFPSLSSNPRNWGHPMKLYIRRFRTEKRKRKHFFTQ